MRGSQADAKSSALRLIDYRPRSRKEMIQRLKLKGFEDDEINGTIEYLERAGLINDEILADGLLKHAIERKLLGKRGAELFLYKRGIERNLISKVISSHTKENEDEAAKKLLEKKLRTLSKQPEEVIKRRLYGMLQRRGFASDVIKAAVSSAMK
ncbi:MAG: regulatory protein RecX [Thermodesulfovibrionia bacterium]|nr:regulatory protein RecX [Thermodesulfovibrionia bacterium]